MTIDYLVTERTPILQRLCVNYISTVVGSAVDWKKRIKTVWFRSTQSCDHGNVHVLVDRYVYYNWTVVKCAQKIQLPNCYNEWWRTYDSSDQRPRVTKLAVYCSYSAVRRVRYEVYRLPNTYTKRYNYTIRNYN